ncbi:MAG: hypothetical protein Q4F66_10990, partial [Clostridium sp.]|nr:hypothetical protein [Clostridium sp.]
MKKYHFSMILSDMHLFKALPLYISLCMRCKDFELFILCMSEKVYDILDKIKFDNITLVLIDELEKNDYNLIQAKSNRSFHEYCWTAKPVFLNYLINKYNTAQYYVHLDADLFFFNDIDRIFNENRTASIFLTDHYNSAEFMHYYDLSGKFNTGFVGFKNDSQGKTAIRIWKDKCIEKCTGEYDTVNKTFGDQRYVEEWPQVFKNVHIVRSKGANTAFWNAKNYRFAKVKDVVYVNSTPLIFYHFSALSPLSQNEVEL